MMEGVVSAYASPSFLSLSLSLSSFIYADYLV